MMKKENEVLTDLIKRIVRRFLPKLPNHIFVLSVGKTRFILLQLREFNFFKCLKNQIK